VFPDAWYDLARFHLKDGTFTGYYVNLITPVEMTGDGWKMFDLCLDLWVDLSGRYWILDRDEFDEAVDSLGIDAATAQRTRQELDRIIAAVQTGRWPPNPVREYDLARVRALSRL
jgi:predicted RNA-binding protein associated with RNAse of E/G family